MQAFYFFGQCCSCVKCCVGFNQAHGFTNTPLNFHAVVNPNFEPRTEVALTYTLGVGMQKPLNKNWQVGIGYEFSDWGKSQLGRANGQTLNSGLKLAHLYTHGLLFNLTYNPFILNAHASCVLSLTVTGSLLTGHTVEAPVVCQQGSSMQCYRASQANILNISRS